MKNLKIKQKVLVLTAVPLLLTVLVLTLISIYQMRAMGDDEVNQIRSAMMAAKREALHNYTEIAKTALLPIIREVKDDREAKERIKQVLRSIGYSDNGYIFAFDYNGLTIVQSAKPELEGKNLMDLEDINGVRLVEQLIKAARNGGGYVSYTWHKPSTDKDAPKLSYALDLKEFSWVLGTGFYIDDIDEAVALKRAEVDRSITNTVIISLVVGLVILVVVVLVNMWFANRALSEPIRQLAENAREMSLGKMDTVIEVDSKDEIGELADAISRMQKSLQVIFKRLRQSPDE